MNASRGQILSLLLAAGAPVAFAAQQPETLAHSLPEPPGADRFGSAIAISGSWVVVGAFGQDAALGVVDAGHAYVYDLTLPTATTPPLILSKSVPAAEDQFGYAVASSDSRVVVGNMGEPLPCIESCRRVVVGTPGDDTGEPNAGSAYLYVIGSTFLSTGLDVVSTTPIFNPSPAAGDNFGAAVAISGASGVVGASSDDAGATDAGSAYVYDFASATTPTLTLHNPAPAAGDGFGSSVAISGTRVVVGAPHDGNGATNAGTAYIYEIYHPTPTVPVTVLQSPSPAEGEFFGSAVGIDGSRVVVGSPGSGPTAAGKAYLYDLTTGTIPVAILSDPTPAPGNGFGSSVAISGTRVVVGSRTSESAYVYDFSSATPASPVATLHDPNSPLGDHFGASVAIDGTTAAVGRPGNETVPEDTGSTHVFIPGWGLADATDFGGNWVTGSRPYNGTIGSIPGYWSGQSATSLDGVDAAEGRLGSSNAAETWMETMVTGPTTLYFSYRVKDFSGPYAGLSGGGLFLIHGVNSTLISPEQGPYIGGDTGWRETSAEIPSGAQTIRWKLSYFRGESDVRAYVDQVWTSHDGRPRITDTANPAARYATPFTWAVPVGSSTPATLTATGLPAGLTLDTVTHVISGTPTEAGVFEVMLTALNGAGKHIAKVAFEIAPGLTSIGEGMDAPNRIFTQTPPGTAWGGVTGIGHDGVDSARGLSRSTALPPTPTLSTTFQGPGTLTFWYRTEAGATSFDYSQILLVVGGPPSSPQTLRAKTWTKVSVPIPEGPQTVSWTAEAFMPTFPPRFVYVDELTFTGHEPEMVVEGQPGNLEVADGGSHSFGEVFVNSAASVSFTVKNIGLANLTGLSPTIDGPNAADFTLTSSPVAPVSGPAGSTTFTVRFAPTTRGAKAAVLHIPNNDSDENPYDINLSGMGLGITLQPVSRQLVQGSPVSFFVVVEGPLPSFQWRKDGVDIPGAVASSLVIPSAQPWHIGEYSVQVSHAHGVALSTSASLALIDVPSGLWRGLVACYAFDGSQQDLCRPGKPAGFLNTSGLATDPQRGGVAHVRGKGWAIPALPGEPVELQGPGGYLQIPRPPLVTGEPFTVSFVIKEEGFSFRHGESFFTMGEGASSTDLLAHYWIGGLDGYPEVYAGPSQTIQTYNSDYMLDGLGVSLNSPWTAFTAVADGNLLRLYRNGQLMGSSPYNQITSGDSFIGRHWWENGGRFSTRLIAKVDDVRIYNRALTEPEIQQLFTLAQTTPPAGSFDSWVLINGLVGADAGLAADPDRDGLTNWEEFCFGTSPRDGTQSPMKAVFAGATLTLEWLEIDGVMYRLKESPNLVAPWTASLSVPTAPADQTGVPTGYHRVHVNIPIPQAGQPIGDLFFRVEATKVP